MDNVINNHTKSCGCYINNSKRKTEGSAFRKLLLDYKSRSKKYNRDFNLTDIEFKNITSKNCYYCNKEPMQKVYSKNKKDMYIYNGIDRVNNYKGYQLDNIVSCCGTCNKMKRDMSYYDFLNYIKRIFHNLNLS